MLDITGVIVLVVAIILFGFLARRAWKLKNAVLKWIGMILTGLLTLVSTLLLVFGVVGFFKLSTHHNNPVADIHVEGTPAQIARGQQLAHICAGCHSPNDQPPLSGANLLGRFPLPPMGTLYAPNLTPSGNIKGWTDGELIRAIREGVHQDGRSLVAMPANDFRFMSDADIQSVVAYLRSQPAVGSPTPDNRFNLVAALMVDFIKIQTVQQPVGKVEAPQTGTAAYGGYLVGVLGCRGCHGPQLHGRSSTPGGPPAPDLTRIVPYWTEAQFMTFFNTGQIPGGSTVPVETLRDGLKAPVMPWNEICGATSDEDLKAIYAYIHNLPSGKGQ